MKKLFIVALTLFSIAQAGIIDKTFYATPTTTTNYLTAKVKITGSNGIVSANGGVTSWGGVTLNGTAANIALGSNYLSGDGDDEGIFVASTGNVGIGVVPVADYSGELPRLKVMASATNQPAITVAGGSPISGWTADAHSGAMRFGNWNIYGDIAYDADGTNGFLIRDIWGGNGKVVLGVGSTKVLYVRDTGTIGRVGIGTSAPSTTLEVAGTVSANDFATVAWTDYAATSTITGWASIAAKYIHYKKVGKTVFVNFYIDGTSNSTAVNFTLPIASVSGVSYFGGVCNLAADNNNYLTTPTSIRMTGNSSTVNVYKGMVSEVWTASLSKTVSGQFWYEATN